MDRITVEQLAAKLADPNVSRHELSRYVLPDPDRSGPFRPALRLNPDTVQEPLTPEARARGDVAMAGANTWARLRRRWAFEAKMAGGYDGPVIVSEGDSWFQYPILLDDVIDHLSGRYAIRSVDAAGDTLQNMFAEGEYLEALQETAASVFLFSAGGNDVLGGGNLREHLRDFDAARSPEDHLLPSYRELMDHAVALYDRIFRPVEALPNPVAIICHGYDRPVPNEGRWLGGPMAERGIADPAFQMAITDAMVDRFNGRLKQLAATFANCTYLDLRNVVGRDPVRWNDELHPTSEAYGDVAARFDAAIRNAPAVHARSGPMAPRPRRRGVPPAQPGLVAAPPVVAGRSRRRGLSLHVGLNTIDPAHYGNDGALAACEFDAEDMADLARGIGYERVDLLLSPAATRGTVIAAIEQAAGELRAGDIFLFTYAGHGSQMPDFNADESDRIDETLCLYDGMLIDDELYALWAKFSDDVRILVVSDSCHSGTVLRKAPTLLAAASTGVGAAGIPEGALRARLLPPTVAGRTFRKHREFYTALGSKAPKIDETLLVRELSNPLRCSVQLLSGCQDNQLSGDGPINGRFTEELLRIWDGGRFVGDYKNFHRQIVVGMPSNQTPNYWMVGRPNPAFYGQRPFSI